MKYSLLALVFLVFSSCDQEKSGSNTTLTGEQLAKSACSSCHANPSPELLPKEQWKSVLPRMGLRLGIPTEAVDPFSGFNLEETQRILQAEVFPDHQILNDTLWQKLQDYILMNAPDSFTLKSQTYPVQDGLFKTVFPKIPLGGAPFVSMVKFDPDDNLYIADQSGNLVLMDTTLEIKAHTFFPKPVIDLHVQDDKKPYVLSIGELYPNDKLTGAIATFDIENFSTPALILDRLPRPVQFIPADLDQDGLEDFVVCNFGNYVGRLTWYHNNGNGYDTKAIKSVPGATRAFLRDIDEDGDLDIIALFAQGDEGISIFYNEVVKFSERKVLRFSPLYGSNDMELVDMDGDGDLDIVLSNGDNGDYSMTAKPYHGIRIFLNNGEYEFEESFFHPFYGASKVRVDDFDNDGDLDIIGASFFPEKTNGMDQSIVLLINGGNMNFTPFSIEGADQGRWMVMDTGDYDKDGDIDVIIGSFTLAHEGIDPDIMKGWQQGEKHILALENQTIP